VAPPLPLPAAAGLCALWWVPPAGPVDGLRWWGSLVEQLPAGPSAPACPAGSVAVRGWSAPAGPAPRPVGELACLPEGGLQAPIGVELLGLPGRYGPVPTEIPCGAGPYVVGAIGVPADVLAPLPAGLADEVRSLEALAAARLGPGGQVRWTGAGRLSLPWTWLDPGARAAERAREGLDTPARAERAAVAELPGGAGYHFTGADPEGSDIWGSPDALRRLIDLLADWATLCPALPGGGPATCPVGLGDLSWYAAQDPDPLGHRDHLHGDCLDLRLFRRDGSRYEAFHDRPDDRPGRGHAYDGTLTRAFVQLALARDDVAEVLFNDPAVPEATPYRGHDDHLHLCLRPPP
jgi:hypothetical protein